MNLEFLPTAREGNVFRSVSQYILSMGGGGVGFPACITGHMTGVGSASRGVFIQVGGSASRGFCVQWGLYPGGVGRPPNNDI